MASSEETLRSPESCLPSIFVITKSSGESMPLFIQVGVVRMRPSANRTDRLPSEATMYPCWYIQRPATQMSRACCASVFAWTGKSESGVMGRTPSWRSNSRAVPSELLPAHPVGTYEMAPPVPWDQLEWKEAITKCPKNLVQI